MKTLIAAFRPAAGWMLLGMLLSLLSLLSNIALLTLSSWFIAATAVAGVSGALFNYLLPSVGVRAFALFRTGGRYLERLVTHDATFRVLASLKRAAYEHFAASYRSGFRVLHSGDAATRLQHDIDTLESFYSRGVVPLVVAAVGVAVTVAFLALYSPVLAAGVGALLLLVGALFPSAQHAALEPALRRRVSARSELRVRLVDYVEGMPELTAAGAAEALESELAGRSVQLGELNRRAERWSAAAEALAIAASGAAVLIAFLAAIPLVRAGALPATHVALLSICALVSFETVQQLPEALQNLSAAREAARRVFGHGPAWRAFGRGAAAAERATASEPAVAADATASDGAARPGTEGPPLLRAERVTLRYPGAESAALRDLDLDLPPGSKSAVVGPVGAGKSSLAALLGGLVTPTGGRIVPSPRLHSGRIAVLEQHPHIFHATVRENLLLARPQAEDEQLRAACSAACFDDVLTALPSGLDSVIGRSGSRLSAGEQKRLALARTLLAPASLIVLDEPTEHLDAMTERSLLRSVFDFSHRQSVLVITHRLAAMDRFDQIFVMESGTVVERGSHAQLLHSGGLYAHMWSMLR